jgi:hypothetical protein
VGVLPALAGITPAAYADPALLSAGFQRAVVIAGILCAAGGVLAFATVRSPSPQQRSRLLPPHAQLPQPRPPQPIDPAVECPACPVLTPHIRPR